VATGLKGGEGKQEPAMGSAPAGGGPNQNMYLGKISRKRTRLRSIGEGLGET